MNEYQAEHIEVDGCQSFFSIIIAISVYAWADVKQW